MAKILVTGANGHLGSATIEHLLKTIPANQIVALVRSEEKGATLKEKGIEIRIGDFNDAASLTNATKGIEKVFLVSGLDENRLQQHKNVIDASKKNGIQHIVYTGVALKDINTSSNQVLMFDHFKTEDYLKESGINYTILRNSIYADAIPMFVGEKVLEQGIFLPAGDGKIPFVLRDELAEASASILSADGHENKTYELTSDQLHSFNDVAGILTELSGKPVTYTNIPAEAFVEGLKQFGLPDSAIVGVVGFVDDFKNGQLEIVSEDLEMLLGRKPTNLKTALQGIYQA